jgi:phospholipid transport system transporter-binding protein
MSAKLEALGNGRFSVSGSLNGAAASSILKQSQELFQGQSQIEIDFTGVSESDSAGLALLIEWLRSSKQHDQRLRFANIPAQISALARISEVEDMLHANEVETVGN